MYVARIFTTVFLHFINVLNKCVEIVRAFMLNCKKLRLLRCILYAIVTKPYFVEQQLNIRLTMPTFYYYLWIYGNCKWNCLLAAVEVIPL